MCLQVLLVFVQDVAFKQSVVVCAGLLFLSLGLHGLAYRVGQNQVHSCVVGALAGGAGGMCPPGRSSTLDVAGQPQAQQMAAGSQHSLRGG